MKLLIMVVALAITGAVYAETRYTKQPYSSRHTGTGYNYSDANGNRGTVRVKRGYGYGNPYTIKQRNSRTGRTKSVRCSTIAHTTTCR